jgi:hypothetical protein
MTKAVSTPWSATGSSISGTAYSPQDHLPLPNGKAIKDVESAQLASLLSSYSVTGVSAANGRSANLQAYDDHLASIRKQAGDNAVTAWASARSLPVTVDAALDATAVARLLADIPGTSHSNAKATNISVYETLLDSVRQQAADAAVNSWLRSHK